MAPKIPISGLGQSDLRTFTRAALSTWGRAKSEFLSVNMKYNILKSACFSTTWRQDNIKQVGFALTEDPNRTSVSTEAEIEDFLKECSPRVIEMLIANNIISPK